MPSKYATPFGPSGINDPVNRFWQWQRNPKSAATKCDVNHIYSYRSATFVKNNIFGENDVDLYYANQHYYQLLLTDENDADLVDENGFNLILEEICF